MDNLINLVVSFLNGLIVGVLSFVLGALDGLGNLDNLLTHAISAVSNFFVSVLTLGTRLFPFVPSEWMAVIESGLIVLAIGIIVRKKVIDS